MVTLPDYSAISRKGPENNFSDFLFDSLSDETLPKRGLLLMKRICSNSFLQELIATEKGGNNDKIRAQLFKTNEVIS